MLCEVSKDEDGKETYKMMTMRNEPKMSLINTRIEGDSLFVWIDPAHWWQRRQSHIISLRPLDVVEESRLVDAKVHSASVCVVDIGDSASRFFSRILGKQVRLVREYRGSRSIVHKAHVSTPTQGSVGLADQYPLLIMSRASIDAVNQGLIQAGERALPLEQFRPNIIVDGIGTSFEEDQWRLVQVGSVEIEVIGPCTRCKLPNVDITTGIKNANNQPYHLLNDTRRVDPLQPRKPVLGVHAMFREQNGSISIGQNVLIL